MAGSAWHVTGVSLQGSSHRKTGERCQDVCDWRELPGGILVAAVADGAGSARLAGEGARAAVRAAIAAADVLALDPSDDELCRVLDRSLDSALRAVEAEAAERSAEPRDLACTLIVVLAAPQWVACAQIGDGAAVIGDGSGAVRLLTAPSSGEYLNETTFVVSPGAIAGAQRVVERGDLPRLAILSDGLQYLSLKMPSPTAPAWAAHQPFFLPLFDFVAKTPDAGMRRGQIERLLDSPRVRGRCDDDLTLFLAARR